MTADLRGIVENFQFEGEFIEARPHGNGHIHDTYVAWFATPGGKPRPYLLQRINQHVFRDPQRLLHNIERVTRHLQAKISARGGDPLRETLTLIPTKKGKSLHWENTGDAWRAYIFIENTHTGESPATPAQVHQAARAYGTFQALLADFPADSLVETIPDFHNTPVRFANLMASVRDDAGNRAAPCRDEIHFVEKRQGEASRLTDLLAKGQLPVRITHNDTKLNNVLFDDASGSGLCVIDLDTVMPGTLLYDFGDAVRSAAALVAEDDPDVSHSGVSLEIFEQLTRGYLESAGSFLTTLELDNLVFSAKLMTLECGMRFLADHLDGDVYFKIEHPGHNLQRSRAQFRLVEAIESHEEEMQNIVEKSRGTLSPVNPLS